MEKQALHKTIRDDSKFLLSLEEDYDDIFDKVLPLMDINVEELEQFYSGEFNFDNPKSLLVSLDKLDSCRLNEFVFYLITKDYKFEGVTDNIQSVVKQEMTSVLRKDITGGYLEFVKYYIEREGFTRSKTEFFTAACENGHLHIAEYLISTDTELYEIDIHVDNFSLFIKAASNNQVHILKFLISLEHKYGKIYVTWIWNDIFYHLAGNGYLNVIEYLLSLEDYKFSEYFSPTQALLASTYEGHLNIIIFILGNNRFNIFIPQIIQVFEIAAKKDHLHILEYFISLDPMYGKIDVRGIIESVFISTAQSGHLRILKYLISLEIIPGVIKFHKNNEALIKSITAVRYLHILEYLISLDSTHGRTNIHIDRECILKNAVFGNHLPVVKYLFSLEATHGAFDIHIDGDYLFEYSRNLPDKEMYEYLRSRVK